MAKLSWLSTSQMRIHRDEGSFVRLDLQVPVGYLASDPGYEQGLSSHCRSGLVWKRGTEDRHWRLKLGILTHNTRIVMRRSI